MAKARDIAALAGLAGLAFANRDKLFGSKDKSSGMTGAQNDALANANTQRAMTGDQNDTLARVNKEAAAGQTDINAAIRKSPAFAPKEATSVAAPAVPAPKSSAAPVTAEPVTAKPVTAKPVVSGQKKNIVSKKQLEDYKKKFGQDKTLRDYMNSQRASANKPIKPVSLPNSYKHGGAIKSMASGGMTASSRADGIATKGKTRGKIC